MAAIIGKKLGMTQVFTEDGSSVPVTVIEAGPCKVTALRSSERDGYHAVQLAFDEVAERKISKAELGHLKKAGAPPSRTLVEFRDEDWSTVEAMDSEEAAADAEQPPDGDGEAGNASVEEKAAPAGPLKVGDDVTVTAFAPGDKVKVSGTSIGKGFQGTIKRHNFSRGPVSHGSHNVRAPGSVGASADPARVFKGMKLPGQMGNKRITQRGLEVVEVDADRNLLLVKGAVPGPKNATVEVRGNG
ncbi:MAG: 50S ribosomal protein L3 [Solirubrobacterales bacterium]